jgi:hypothetical protein
MTDIIVIKQMILDIESYLGNCVCLPLECEDFIKIIGSTTIKIFPRNLNQVCIP